MQLSQGGLECEWGEPRASVSMLAALLYSLLALEVRPCPLPEVREKERLEGAGQQLSGQPVWLSPLQPEVG